MEVEDATRPFNMFNTLVLALEPGSGTVSASSLTGTPLFLVNLTVAGLK